MKIETDSGKYLIDEPAHEPLLTVEDYSKWYDLYVLNPDGSHRRFEGDLDGWYGHYITPLGFVKAANEAGLKFTQTSFNAVCELYVCYTGDQGIGSEIMPEHHKYVGSLYYVLGSDQYEDWSDDPLGEFCEGAVRVSVDGERVLMVEAFTGTVVTLSKSDVIDRLAWIAGDKLL